jgi:predicted transcriptional regulator YheO
MHGHPLQETGLQPKTYDPAAAFDYAGQGLNETHRRLIVRLSEGTFYAVPTLAGHLNIKKESVYHYLSGLKKAAIS